MVHTTPLFHNESLKPSDGSDIIHYYISVQWWYLALVYCRTQHICHESIEIIGAEHKFMYWTRRSCHSLPPRRTWELPSHSRLQHFRSGCLHTHVTSLFPINKIPGRWTFHPQPAISKQWQKAYFLNLVSPVQLDLCPTWQLHCSAMIVESSVKIICCHQQLQRHFGFDLEFW